jgi:uncharacterized protein YdaT
MPWNKKNFPESYQSFNKPVRDKAIQIANAMLSDSKYSHAAIIPIAAAAAMEWARSRDIPVSANSESGPNYQVVPHRNRWAVKAEHGRYPTAVYDTKTSAISRGLELAMRHLSQLVIYDSDGNLQEKRNYDGA